MREMYYVNHLGEVVRFDRDRLRIKAYDLRNFTWDYTATNLPYGIGGRITRFHRKVQVKSLTVVARGRNAAECVESLNRLHEVTETDIAALTPGRFYLDGQYLICYLGVSSSLDAWEGGYHYAVKTLSVATEYPYWTTERPQSFYPAAGEQVTGGKRYPNRYPHRYGTGYAMQTLINDHYTPAPFVLTVFGPCANPSVTIAGVQYGAEITLLKNERLVLDQINRTIVKVGATGTVTNQFDRRIKVDYPYTPAPVGVSRVQYGGGFGFEIVLHYQRSEPKWT